MKTCKGCGEAKVDPDDPPRYDVLKPNYNPDEPLSTVGPYCAECWPSTVTGSLPSA